MKRTVLVIMGLVIFGSLAFAKDKLEDIKIHVAEQAESSPIRLGNRGRGRTRSVVFAVNVIIRNQHVRLICDENHKGCTDFGPGDYDGQLKGNSVWIMVPEPLTEKVRREHFKISGSW